MKNAYKASAIAALTILHVFSSFAQETSEPVGYQITDIKVLQYTPVKDQNQSSTCWSYSTLALLESELLRMGKPEVDLSEMFIVWHTYSDKATKYVRLNGNMNFAGGGSSYDVIQTIKHHGIVPQEVYSGLQYGEPQDVHGELDEVTRAYVEAVIKNRNRKLSTAWKKGFEGIIDAYLGPIPQQFNFEGKDYTPASYFQSLGLNLDDYVQLTSFSHHPFYSQFILEVPDNWAFGNLYNLPLDEFMEVFNYAIENGYTIAWGSDTSEKGFSYKNGVAVVPDANLKDMTDSEKSKWAELSQSEKDEQLYKFDKPGVEKAITQEIRQEAFDNYTTTDDHGMLIVGTAKDQNGNKYFKVKNSWGTSDKYNGLFYASDAYVRYKTISVMIHKNAIPKATAKKLGL